MKLNAKLGDSSHEVSVRREGNTALAEVDGRAYRLELRHVGPGQFLLLEGTRVYNCRVEQQTVEAPVFTVQVGPDAYEVRLIDPKRLRGSAVTGAHHHGSAEVVAPMPGKVVRALVALGQEVAAGAGIVVVEAMKMQNELKSPRAGTIALLNAEIGATVNAGDVLAVIE